MGMQSHTTSHLENEKRKGMSMDWEAEACTPPGVA